MAARYALYYAPHKDEPLYRLMAPLFGRDCRDGSHLPGGPVAPAGVEHGLWTSLDSVVKLCLPTKICI